MIPLVRLRGWFVHWMNILFLIHWQSVLSKRSLITLWSLLCASMDFSFTGWRAKRMTIFQGAKIGITQQISDDYVLHIQGIQCMVHHTYLVVQVLSKLNMVNKLESLFQTLYDYFYKSPRRHLGLIKLTKILGIKRNRPPNNGTSRSTVKKKSTPSPSHPALLWCSKMVSAQHFCTFCWGW